MQRQRLGIVLGIAVFILSACVQAPDTRTGRGPRPPRGEPVKVGVLLPLAGDIGLYGRSMLHGVECGAGVKSPCASRANIQLVTRDVSGAPAKSVAAIKELAAQEQVVGVVGPLETEHAMAAAAQAEALQLPMVSLSPGSKVANVGPYVYRVGANPARIVQTVAQYAVKERGFKRFGILYPKSHYGEVNRDIFRDAVTALGGQIAVERPYAGNLLQIIEARERAERAPSTPAAGGGESLQEGQMPEVTAPPPLPKLSGISGVDAIYIPDAPRAIAGILKAYGEHFFGSAVLLGNNRFNSPDLTSLGRAAEGAIFADGFFRDSAQSDTQQFVSTFMQAYGIEPTRLEAEGYDAMQFMAEGIRRGGRTPAALQGSLQRLRKLHGVTGKMRFMDNGDVEKDLFLLTVSDGRIQELGMRAADLRTFSPGGDGATSRAAERGE